MLTQLTPPAAEPIARADAKRFLRIDHDAEDDLVDGLIRAARETVEALSGAALVTRTLREKLDRWPLDDAGALVLQAGPLARLVAIRVDGASLDLAGAIVVSKRPPRACLPSAPPRPTAPLGGIEIDYEAGFGPAPADAPEALRQAVRLVLGALYEGRSGGARIPEAAHALIAPFRPVRL